MQKYFFLTFISLLWIVQCCVAQLPVDKYYRLSSDYVMIESTKYDFSATPIDSVIFYREKAKAYLKKLKPSESSKTLSAYLYLTEINLKLKAYENALGYLYKSLKFPEIENSPLRIGLHWNIFKIYEYSENYNGMLEELNALRDLESKFDSRAINSEKLRAGILYRAGFYTDAKNVYRNNLIKDSLTLDPVKYAVILNDLAGIYAEVGLNDSVSYFRKKALYTIKRSSKSSFGPSYRDFIDDYIVLQDLLFKEEFSQQSLVLAKKFLNNSLLNHSGEIHTAVFAHQFLACYHLNYKNYDQALLAINEAIELGLKNVHLNKLRELYFVKYRILDASDEREQAKQSLIDLNKIKDAKTIVNRNFDLIKYDVNQLENARNRAQNAAMESEMKYEYSLFTLVFVGLLLVIVISFAFIIYKKNISISLARSEVSKRLEEKDFLLKELNHRVKNNLALIISLIQFQADDLDDELYKKKIYHLENRITAIAIAHEQFLYSNNDFIEEEYNLREYIVKIANGITSISPRDVKFYIHVEKLYFNIDTALPIGILLNELISNSVEHAVVKKDLIINVNIMQQQRSIVINFKDNGEVFDYQAKKTSLGLTIIESMVEQLMGTIVREQSNYSITIAQKNIAA